MKLKISISHWLGMTAGLGLVAVSTYAAAEGGTAGLLTIPSGVFGALGVWMVWLDILMSQRSPTKRQAELREQWKRKARETNLDGTPMIIPGVVDMHGRMWGDTGDRWGSKLED